MSKEKKQTKIDKSASDHATDESGPGAVDEKKLLRKLDWHLIPGLTLLFLLSFLDRSNGNILSPFVSATFPPLILFQLEMLVSKVWSQTCT